MANYFTVLDHSGTDAAVFNVRDYGAAGDGATDDTAAINAAIAAAYAAGLANGTNYAEVFFSAATYLLSSATTKSASNKGNAQIWLPLVATTAQKFVLVLRGARCATALPHWQQTSVQRAGSVLKSTLTGQVVDGTYGPPSVVGGPTPAQGYGVSAALFNNMQIVVDGISIVVPSDPTVIGFDFSGMAEATVISASVNASTVPGSAEPTAATSSWAVGLYVPQTRNNDNCLVVDYSCEGMYFGMIISEHATVLHCQIIYCVVGIDVLTGADYSYIGYASVELCKYALRAEDNGGGFAKIRVGMLDIEQESSGNFTHVRDIDDGSDLLKGEIVVHCLAASGTSDTDPVVNGAANVRIIRADRVPGNVTAPAVPATTVALRNPFWRDAAVHITGGTVTVTAVDGVATGITVGTVMVPTGKTVTLTYSAAPSWIWTLS